MQETSPLTKKEQKKALICACLIGFAFSVNYTNHAPLKEWLIHDYKTASETFTKAMFGFLTTAIFLTHAVMQIPGGHLADKFGPKRVLAIALLIVFTGNVGFTLAQSYQQLVFWKFFVGVGTGTAFVSGARYIYQSMPPEKLLIGQGYYGASVLLGSGFVIFAVPQIADLASAWRPAFYATAVVAAIAFFVWLTQAPSPSPKVHPPTSLATMLSNGQLWLLGAVQMTSFGLLIVVGSWITVMLREHAQLESKWVISAVASTVLLLGIFTRPLGGKLLPYMGVRRLIIASLLMNATGCFILAFFTKVFVADLMAILLLGIGCGLPYAGLFNTAARLFPGRAGAAMGLVNMLGIVFILVGSPLVGFIVDYTGGFSSAFITLGISAVIGCLFSLRINQS